MRNVIAETITDAALQDDRVMVLSGDFGFKTFDRLKTARPRQYHNVGVCEQAMVGAAAGMAIGGLVPVLFTITPFLLERAFEQIKLDVGRQNLPVVLVGYDNYAKDGPSHTPLNARAMCSLVDNLDYVRPEDGSAVCDAISAALQSNGPTFIHLTKSLPQKSELPFDLLTDLEHPTNDEILSEIKHDQI
jgi:transketolase